MPSPADPPATTPPSLLSRAKPWLATFTFSVIVALVGAAFVRAFA